MTFDLRVTFSGLCACVPDSDEGRMHVLMPAVPADADGAPGRHVPVLSFDAAHLRPDSPGPQGAAPPIPLRGYGLTLDGAPVAFDARGETGEITIRLDVPPNPGLRTGAGGAVASCVTLGGGSLSEEETSRWRISVSEIVQILRQVHWTARMEGPSLRLTLAALDGSGEAPLPPLFPMDGCITLKIEHLPAEGRPVVEESGAPVFTSSAQEHFASFHELLSSGEPPSPLPPFPHMLDPDEGPAPPPPDEDESGC